jgi:hypothetical protein
MPDVRLFLTGEPTWAYFRPNDPASAANWRERGEKVFPALFPFFDIASGLHSRRPRLVEWPAKDGAGIQLAQAARLSPRTELLANPMRAGFGTSCACRGRWWAAASTLRRTVPDAACAGAPCRSGNRGEDGGDASSAHSGKAGPAQRGRTPRTSPALAGRARLAGPRSPPVGPHRVPPSCPSVRGLPGSSRRVSGGLDVAPPPGEGATCPGSSRRNPGCGGRPDVYPGNRGRCRG